MNRIVKKILCFMSFSLLLTGVAFSENQTLSITMGNISESGIIFSYPNAVVNGPAGTSITSLQINVTNGSINNNYTSANGGTCYTDAMSAHQTVMWTWPSGKNLADIQTFLRSFQFIFVEGMKINISIDSNVTNIPDGAKITQYTPTGESKPHYYMYIETKVGNSSISWTAAYNNAKSFSYMGMKGYLTTITEAGEDALFDSIAGIKGAWSGGARFSDSITTFDLDTCNTYGTAQNSTWRWACGPEAGEPLKINTYKTGVKGATDNRYNHWNIGQPDGNGASGEWCMQIHFEDANNRGFYGWNDLPVDYPSLIYGYFVEFSDYPNGYVNGYSASNSCSISEIPKPVAKIGDTVYISLLEAVQNAQSNDEIVLLRNPDETLVTVSKNIKINGNGKTIPQGLTVSSGYECNIKNIRIENILTVNGILGISDTVTVVHLKMNVQNACIILTGDVNNSSSICVQTDYTTPFVKDGLNYLPSKKFNIFVPYNIGKRILNSGGKLYLIDKDHKVQW